MSYREGVMATSKKKSPIWDYFTIDDDQIHITIRNVVTKFLEEEKTKS